MYKTTLSSELVSKGNSLGPGEIFFLNDGLFRTLEVILQSYMPEKMLISNSKKTVQDYQCELNFGGLGIDIRESMHLFRVYNARKSSGITDSLNFKVLIDCRTTTTRFVCYDPDLRLIVILILYPSLTTLK